MRSNGIYFVFRKNFRQVLIYGLIGVFTNLTGYSIYYLLTLYGGGPKIVMTLLYVIGCVLSFFANRRFTFQHDGSLAKAGLRNVFVQILGYLLNLLLLVIFVDWLGFSHLVVQGVAIIVVAVFLFILSRLFVFPVQSSDNGAVRS